MHVRKIIGVTGSLATGKTTVTELLAEKGAKKIDADEIAHEILEEDKGVIKEVVELFGDKILSDCKINRRKHAKEVFFNKEKLKRYCLIIHPAIIWRIKEEVERAPEWTVAVDAPLLIEAELNNYVDIVVVVTADEKTQIERARSRGISEKEAKSIIANQMPLSEKVKFADYIIENSGNLEAVKKGVDEVWQNL